MLINVKMSKMLINVKVSTIVGILTFMSRMNFVSTELLEQEMHVQTKQSQRSLIRDYFFRNLSINGPDAKDIKLVHAQLN